MPDLTCSFAGVPLKNPIVAAAAATTENADRLKRCEDAGCAAGVIKSYFEYEPARHSPTPRFRVLRDDLGRHRNFALYSFEQANVAGLDEFCEQIARAKESCEMKIFASLNCNTDERWAEGAAMVEQAGADLLELNVSCPHGTHQMAHLPMAEVMAHAVEITRSACNLPIVPKVTPQLDNPMSVVAHMRECGADGVVMFNRFTGLDIDLQTEAPILHGGYAGHGGPWAIHYTMRWISETSRNVDIPIAASGGVASGDDVAKLLLVGATVTQTCTAIVMEGYEVVGRLLEGLSSFMEEKGYETIDEFRGKAAGRILGNDEIDRVGRRYASVSVEDCVNCGLCERICIYDAVREVDGHREIDPETCDGCGLCVELCPVGCISMVEREQPRTFTLGVK
ncbi:MAG: 4Fe-4S binding protein [Armatimonadetes bacterium]|nr:4Fe-4S binding protein [Armatimonadota bacterium]